MSEGDSDELSPHFIWTLLAVALAISAVQLVGGFRVVFGLAAVFAAGAAVRARLTR